MFLSEETVKTLEAASKETDVQYTPYAAKNTIAINELVKVRKITSKKMDSLLERVANSVLKRHDESKRLRGPKFDIRLPQDTLDDLYQLNDLTSRMKQKLTQLPTNKVLLVLKKRRWVSKFVTEMNAEFDKVLARQSISIDVPGKENLGQTDTDGRPWGIEMGNGCHRARIEQSGSVVNNGYVDPSTGKVFTTTTSSPGARIKFGNNSEDATILNSGNVTNTIMPLQPTSGRGQNRNDLPVCKATTSKQGRVPRRRSQHF